MRKLAKMNTTQKNSVEVFKKKCSCSCNCTSKGLYAWLTNQSKGRNNSISKNLSDISTF